MRVTGGPVVALGLILAAASASACGTDRHPADRSAVLRDSLPQVFDMSHDEARREDSSSTQASAVFEGTTGDTETPTLPDMPTTLREVRTSESSGYERVVFDFGDGRLPGYRIGYIAPPAQDCGSGADALLAGAAVLSVRLRPAQAHAEVDSDMRATISERDRAPRYRELRQMRMVCDFEGSVEWALGLRETRRYRILTLEKPTRLVVDIEATAR